MSYSVFDEIITKIIFRGAMKFHEVIASTRSKFDGFNSPASADNLSKLQAFLGFLPEDLRAVYEDHDGAESLPEASGVRLAARLMPITEVIENRGATLPYADALPKVGEVAWLWTDDDSNYVGIYTDGLLCGWLCVLDHEEPMRRAKSMRFASQCRAVVVRRKRIVRFGRHA